MAFHGTAALEERGPQHAFADDYYFPLQSHASAVSWGAIMGGAAAAAALSLILLILGSGLGLSAVSPWVHNGVSARTFGVSTILWLTLTQLTASGLGGYLAGRLRTKWAEAPADENYFRDTAHGFLAWAVASLVTAALLTSAIGSIVGGGIQTGASALGTTTSAAAAATAGAASAAGVNSHGYDGPMGYFVDSLFRKNPGAAAGDPRAAASAATSPGGAAEPPATGSSLEIGRIFTNTIGTEPLPADDVRHVGQLVSQRTGLTQQEAEKRVTDTYARLQARLRDAEIAAKAAADKARKASAIAALWLFISLLTGAFVASLAATYGGRRRDA